MIRIPASKASGRVWCLLCALAVVLVLFGDVLFLGASLAPIDYSDALANPNQTPRTVSVLPERPGRSFYHGQGDIGAAAFQLEPAQMFLAFCMRHGESPYWDPYTATGSLGPETLVDIKFSPLSVVTALFGGSSKALSFVLVGLYFLSAFCLLRVVTVHLSRSRPAAFAACALFFLNGFALGNLYTQIGQPYFLAPLLLLAMFIATTRPSPAKVALGIGANVLFLATTFFPTTILLAIVVYGIVFCVRFTGKPSRWRPMLALLVVLPIGALALLSFLYIPIFTAYLTYLDTVKQYSARLTPGISLLNLISLFTPKHIWESYRAIRMPLSIPEGNYNPWIQHVGIAGPVIAIHAFSATNRATFWPVCCLGAFISAAFGQIFGIFPFTLLDWLPFFSFVRNEYWSAMLTFALVLLVAYGFDALQSSNSSTYSSIALIAVILCAFFVMYRHVRGEQARIAMFPSAANSGFTVDIDIPGAQDGSFSGPSHFGGWAINTKSAIKRVAIAVDGRGYGDAEYDGLRSDVCRAHPKAAGCPYVGWDFVLDTTRFSDGPHTLEVIAYADGQAPAAEVRQFKISNPWAPSYVKIFWSIVIAICLTLVLARNQRLTRYAKIAALVIMVCEGMFYMNNLRPYRSKRDENLAPVISWLKTRTNGNVSSRILNIGSTGVFPNWGSALQVPQLGNLNSSGDLPWYRDFFRTYIGRGLFLSLDKNDAFLFSDASLSLAGVRYVVVDRSITRAVDRLSTLGYQIVNQDAIRLVFENPHPMPRAFVVHEWLKSDKLPLDLGRSVTTTVSTTDGRLVGELRHLGLMEGSQGGVQLSESDKVEVIQYRHDLVRVRFETRAAGVLILMDSWHPQWTATLDGKEVYVGKANVAFRGIAAPAGRHEITFRYRPRYLFAGEIASSIAFLGGAALLMIWRMTGEPKRNGQVADGNLPLSKK